MARKIGSAICILLALGGVASVVGSIREALAGTLETPYETFAFGVGLLLLGAAGFRYFQLQYRGGAFSIFGGFLAYLAFFDAGYIVEKLRTRNDVRLSIELAVFFTLAIAAALLLMAGKTLHAKSEKVRNHENP